jgi:hypothetical protein
MSELIVVDPRDQLDKRILKQDILLYDYSSKDFYKNKYANYIPTMSSCCWHVKSYSERILHHFRTVINYKYNDVMFIVNSNCGDFCDLKFKIIKANDKPIEVDSFRQCNCKNYLSKSEFVDLALNYNIQNANYHAILAYMFLSEDVGTLEALEKCLIFA